LAALVPADEAVPLLRAALQTAEASGAGGVRAQVAAALAGHGVPVGEPDPAAVPLTTTERRVMQLHAEGQDIRFIAQALCLTPRTVERTLAALQNRP
ncbi:MAG: Bacterial regulatory protein luxR family, partial [Actinomycetota bacterium]|nr:Bacterial regulatory protein luxR family [Actinomycetota bacterium]